MGLVFNKRKFVEQRFDGSFFGTEEVNINPKRVEVVAHISLINFATLHNPNRGEQLAGFARWVTGFWGIVDKAICGLQLLKRGFFAVILLHKAAANPDLDKGARDNAYPKLSA